MGKEATAFVKRLGIEGKEVRLEYDVEKRDRYGRSLAYVWFDIKCGEEFEKALKDDLYLQTMRKNTDPTRCATVSLQQK